MSHYANCFKNSNIKLHIVYANKKLELISELGLDTEVALQMANAQLRSCTKEGDFNGALEWQLVVVEVNCRIIVRDDPSLRVTESYHCGGLAE